MSSKGSVNNNDCIVKRCIIADTMVLPNTGTVVLYSSCYATENNPIGIEKCWILRRGETRMKKLLGQSKGATKNLLTHYGHEPGI